MRTSSEAEVRDALHTLDPLWDELFPAEQARLVQLLVERVEIAVDGIAVRLRVDGLSGVARRDGGAGGDGGMRNVPAETMTVKVPIEFKRRRGRKRIVAPEGTELEPAASPLAGEVDNALVKAIARAYRWQRMLESGEYATLRELAKAERLDAAYVSRVLQLTLLAPPLVEAILEGRQPEGLTLKKLKQGVPVEWSRVVQLRP